MVCVDRVRWRCAAGDDAVFFDYDDDAPTTRAAAATRKADLDHARGVVRAAIAALGAEYDKSVRSPAAAPLRTASDYFVEHPAGNLPAEVILDELLAPIAGDARRATYVRWQLLSGLPAKLDDSTVQQLLQAYRAAPEPGNRPGMSEQDQQKFERMTQGAREADEPDLKQQLEQMVEAAKRDNSPILAYREELYRRLPKGPETFAAALEDLFERTAAGADAKGLLKAFCKDVKAWSTESDASHLAMRELAKTVRRLADTKSPPYYDTPSWRDKAGVFAWRKTRSDVDPGHALKDLAKLLEQTSQQPEIKLK